MSDIVTKATRQGYAEGLLYLGEHDDKVIVMDADLASATQTKKFRDAYPDRFFNAGIAEQNLMSVAAGLSLSGFTVFASSFAMFASGRAFEQVRNSIGYPHLNVKVAATHGGISVGEDGATHQCNEDLALMRTIPGMTVINPADAVEAKAAVIAVSKIDGPCYLRFGRLAVPVIYDEKDFIYEIGKANVLREGRDVTIIATGLMVNEALIAFEKLRDAGISARIIDMHTIKPLDTDAVSRAASDTGAIVTAEEHSIIGGLGGAVSEYTAENCPVPVVKVGVNDVFGCSGPAKDLLKKFGLDSEDIVRSARAAISKKYKK